MVPRPFVFLLTVTALLCSLFYFSVGLGNFSVRNTLQEYSALPVDNGFPFIQDLYRPYIHPIDALEFDDQNGKTYSLPQMPRFTKPLREKILILDVDTRPLDGPGELLNGTRLNTTSAHHNTIGRLSHYIYATIHGYDYKLIQASSPKGLHGTWSKVTAMKEALKYYEFVIFLDGDAMIRHPHLPMEWLFNYWDITPDTLVAMALDPDEPQNRDAKGKTLLNTGFIIGQRDPRTQELFEAWESCPTDMRYPDCSKWSQQWSHEQAAFGNHLRYDNALQGGIKTLSCAEANGYPEMAKTNCTGEFIRHYWIFKDLLPAAVESSITQYFLPRVQGLFHQNFASVVLNISDSAVSSIKE
ncbi:Pc22g19880 [Penicillium rubens Wisconsin 54-1255]|uniref:Pc22g19880 protein n=2 Tax=Penicillium chrysogenum species complex TaxID=254878 RepID=B6HQ30_PENRW|nr:Pc22g19880 [Penicillium rubens Wisconsin 54-1255]